MDLIERIRNSLARLTASEKKLLAVEFELRQSRERIAELERALSASATALSSIGDRQEKSFGNDLEMLCFRALMDNLPDGIYFKDINSRFLFANSAAAMRKGLHDPAELVGKSDADFFSTEHAQRARADELAIITSGKPSIGIVEKATRIDGQEVWFSATKMPLRDSAGRIIGTFGISRDITDLKKAELEKISAVQQLSQAQKMDAFGQLAGGIAHDFNNMLGGILGFAELIQRRFSDIDPTLRQYASMIVDTAKRGGDLTAELLAFARKGNYAVIAFNVHDCITDVVKLFEHTIDKRIIIHQRLEAGSAIIMGDRTQIQNALLNLAVNARDAMPRGGTITFATATESIGEDYAREHCFETKPGTYLKLSVIDSGIGMDKETQSRIFEPFFTTKQPGKGTGLGLASVYGTVKNHNGYIEVFSEPGKGSTFVMYLPLVDMPVASVEAPSVPVATGTGTILVVDDEEIVRKVLAEMLRDMGYQVATCKDGVEALTYYREHAADIDLAIIDMIMPFMGGYDCVKEMKKINPAVRVVIATGYSLTSDTQKLVTRGIDGFIQKPFQESELSEVVKSALRKRPDNNN